MLTPEKKINQFFLKKTKTAKAIVLTNFFVKKTYAQVYLVQGSARFSFIVWLYSE